MSVIVKGMEMPEECYYCPLCDREYRMCNILKIVVHDDYIPKECPLVEVVRCKDCKHSRTDDSNSVEPEQNTGKWNCEKIHEDEYGHETLAEVIDRLCEAIDEIISM